MTTLNIVLIFVLSLAVVVLCVVVKERRQANEEARRIAETRRRLRTYERLRRIPGLVVFPFDFGSPSVTSFEKGVARLQSTGAILPISRYHRRRRPGIGVRIAQRLGLIRAPLEIKIGPAIRL